MDFDLSVDQEALADGIRKVCEGRFPSRRCGPSRREAWTAVMARSSPRRAVFALRLPEADGGWPRHADAVLRLRGSSVGPSCPDRCWPATSPPASSTVSIRASASSGWSGGARAWCSSSTSTRSTSCSSSIRRESGPWTELARCRPDRPAPRPADPDPSCRWTLARPSGGRFRGGGALVARGRRLRLGPVCSASPKRPRTSPPPTPSSACSSASRSVPSRRSSTSGRHARADRGGAGRGLRRRCDPRRPGGRRSGRRRGHGQDDGRKRPRCSMPKPGSGLRRHGLHLGGRCPSLPEAGVGARDRLRQPPTSTPKPWPPWNSARTRRRRPPRLAHHVEMATPTVHGAHRGGEPHVRGS